MIVSDLELIKEPTEEYPVTQYYLVLDETKQVITWWSQHYDDLKIGDEVEMVEQGDDMKWKVRGNMMTLSKVKLKPMNIKSKNEMKENKKLNCNVEVLRLALTHCHHMDSNDDYEIYRTYHFFMNIENQPGFEKMMDESVKWQFSPEEEKEEVT